MIYKKSKSNKKTYLILPDTKSKSLMVSRIKISLDKVKKDFYIRQFRKK